MIRRVLRSLVPLLSLFAVIGMLRVLEAATTLTGQVTIPSPTLVQPGPIVLGQQLRIGEAITNTFDPRVSGLTRPVGSMVYSRDGSTAYIKTGTTQAAWEKLSAGSIGSASEQTALIARAAALTGISPALLNCYRDDFFTSLSTLHTVGVGGTGAASISAGSSVVGSFATITTGASASGRLRFFGQGSQIGRPDTNKFYYASRAAVTTAIDAQTFAIVGLADRSSLPVIGLGVCGNTSTANFVADYDATTFCTGTKPSTGKAIDTSQHVWEMWSTGTTALHFAVDLGEISGSPFTQASSPTASIAIYGDITNGTTAATRSMDMDWVLVCWSET